MKWKSKKNLVYYLLQYIGMFLKNRDKNGQSEIISTKKLFQLIVAIEGELDAGVAPKKRKD